MQSNEVAATGVLAGSVKREGQFFPVRSRVNVTGGLLWRRMQEVALDVLPPEQFEVFHEVYVEGKRLREVDSAPRSTAHARLQSALDLLKQALDDDPRFQLYLETR